MKFDTLINVAEASRVLTGNNRYINKTRCAAKYRPAMDELNVFMRLWRENINEMSKLTFMNDDTPVTSTVATKIVVPSVFHDTAFAERTVSSYVQTCCPRCGKPFANTAMTCDCQQATPEPNPTGWICPKCGAGVNPELNVCPCVTR